MRIHVVGRASKSGELEPLYKPRGEAASLQTLMKCLDAEGFTGGKLRIRHSDNAEDAEALAEMILSAYPSADIRIGENADLRTF